jgi:putative peptidoglycan lipid II flippase
MNLHKTLAAISGMTMLAHHRTGPEILFVRAFGASAYTDAFNIAFRIPNLLRRLFAEGAFSQAFVPILAEYKNQRAAAETKQLVDHVATADVGHADHLRGRHRRHPFVVYFIATGLQYNPDAFHASVLMTRIMFPYIGFMAFVALAGGILNTWKEFKIPAFTRCCSTWPSSWPRCSWRPSGTAHLRHGFRGAGGRHPAGGHPGAGTDEDRHAAAPVLESAAGPARWASNGC